MMTSLTSKNLLELLNSREKDYNKDVSSAILLTSVAELEKDNKHTKTSSEDDKTKDTDLQQRQNMMGFGSNAIQVCEESLFSWKTTEFDSDKIATRSSQATNHCYCF